MDNILLAKKIATAVQHAGGRVFFVGGCVRDRLMGIESSDVDIEVHGIHPEQLEQILDNFGQRKEVGKSFGIYMLEHHTLDIALPRKETATGTRHRDFKIEVDPFISTEDAARRRDFTVNAMMQDVLTGEIIDHFDGKKHLKKRLLRHIDDKTFIEDPLRVLRAAQFAARFNFSVDKDTVNICKAISLDTLSCERVMEELKKALLFSPTPSRFFTFLRECNQLNIWFKELSALIGVPQNPKFHAEGDVWNHTMLVLDAAAELREKAKEPLFFMMSALLHDVGKAVTTTQVDGIIRSYNHEQKGIPLAQTALKRLSNERNLHRYVLNMIKLHMRPGALASQNSSMRATNRLFDSSICPEDLLLLAAADNAGRLPQSEKDHMAFLTRRLSAYRQLLKLPQVCGQDLISAGLKPDEHFKVLLSYAHKLHLSGINKNAALQQTLAYYKELTKNDN